MARRHLHLSSREVGIKRVCWRHHNLMENLCWIILLSLALLPCHSRCWPRRHNSHNHSRNHNSSRSSTFAAAAATRCNLGLWVALTSLVHRLMATMAVALCHLDRNGGCCWQRWDCGMGCRQYCPWSARCTQPASCYGYHMSDEPPPVSLSKMRKCAICLTTSLPARPYI